MVNPTDTYPAMLGLREKYAWDRAFDGDASRQDEIRDVPWELFQRLAILQYEEDRHWFVGDNHWSDNVEHWGGDDK